MSEKKPRLHQKNYHKRKGDKRFYIIYSTDELALPVAIKENLNEVVAFFGKKYDVIRSDLSKRKTNEAYKNNGIKAADGKKYAVIKWEENGQEVIEI